MRGRESVLALASCLASLGAACSSNSANYYIPRMDAGATMQVVGASGGTVSADDGTTVDIPAGALTEDVTITISANPFAPAMTQATSLAVAHQFGPEGQHFLKPISVTVPFLISSLPPGAHAQSVSVYTAASNSTSYVALPTTVTDATHVTATTTSFCNMIPGANGGTGNVVLSDRNLKRDIEPVDEQAVLERVAGMPVSTWSYKSDGAGVRHLGPMAQDFSVAFGLGSTDRAYDSVDAHGVALAAIKALYERGREQDARIERLERENAELRRGGLCSSP
jgi:hypothetical protein